MDDGTRTHDDWNHNPGLYQLSYTHHKTVNKTLINLKLARPTGIEPVTVGLEGRCSILLSYGRRFITNKTPEQRHKNGRGREIRTPDILLPKQARYQAALYPDFTVFFRVACNPAL